MDDQRSERRPGCADEGRRRRACAATCSWPATRRRCVASTGTYHRECFEAWYFGRYGKRPALLAGANGNRHRFQVRESAAMQERAA